MGADGTVLGDFGDFAVTYVAGQYASVGEQTQSKALKSQLLGLFGVKVKDTSLWQSRTSSRSVHLIHSQPYIQIVA